MKWCFINYISNIIILFFKGFYSVYRNLFHKLSAEEYTYIEDMDDRNFPMFGNANSTYEMVFKFLY